MKLYNKSILMLAVGLTMTACSDFLDKEPTDQGTEAITFKTPEQFEQAANRLYCFGGKWDVKFELNLDTSGIGANDAGTTGESHGTWGFGGHRECNILLEKAASYAGPLEDMTASHPIATSVGTAYFFRAWHHFNQLRTFGGVPIIDHVIDTSDPVVYGKRNSRYEVAYLVMNDLKRAVDLLPKRSTLSGLENRGKLTREGAQGFLARVALYEATWEKYTPSIGIDLDGDGESVGAGKFKPEGYPSVEEWLALARDMSKAVIDEAERGTFALWDECSDTGLSYYYLFNLDDANGNIANYKGVGKATNKEFIINNPYDVDLKKGGSNLAYTVTTGQSSNISAWFGESFVCSNGLPIHLSTSSSYQDAYYNEEFGGYDTFEGEFENRDMRFIGCIIPPYKVTWTAATEYGDPMTALGNPYPEPLFPEPSDSWNPSDPANVSKRGVYTPMIGVNSTHNGYGCRKYLIEGAGRSTNQESADWPVLRLAEVHCIYAEAVCELGNGAISDADLDFSINKNRARAKVARLTNSLIAGKFDAGWFNFATGSYECHAMTMLDEIRRERTCELFAENFRMDDLKRWGIAHINLNGRKLGRRILGTAYTNPANTVNGPSNVSNYYGEPAYNPQTRPLQYGMASEDPASPDYGRPIATRAENCFWNVRQYLDFIPEGQRRLNPNLTQKPGW